MSYPCATITGDRANLMGRKISFHRARLKPRNSISPFDQPTSAYPWPPRLAGGTPGRRIVLWPFPWKTIKTSVSLLGSYCGPKRTLALATSATSGGVYSFGAFWQPQDFPDVADVNHDLIQKPSLGAKSYLFSHMAYSNFIHSSCCEIASTRE